MPLSPEEEALFQALDQKFASKFNSPVSEAIKTVASPITSIPARYEDFKRILGGASPSEVLQNPTNSPNPLNSLHGLGQGLLGGAYPYAQAGALSLVDLLNKGNTDYSKNVDTAKSLMQQAQQDNPLGYSGGEAVGMLLNPINGLGRAQAITNHPILGNGLMAILQGQYGMPLESSGSDRLNNAVESFGVGAGIPLLARIPGRIASITLGNPNAGEFLAGTRPSLSTAGLQSNVDDQLKNIGRQMDANLSRNSGQLYDVSGTLTPNNILSQALKSEASGDTPVAVNTLQDIAARMQGQGGKLNPPDINELKVFYNNLASYNSIGSPGAGRVKQAADNVSSGLREILYNNNPELARLNQMYGAGKDISKTLSKLQRNPIGSSEVSKGVLNLISSNALIPTASLLNNSTVSPLLKLLQNQAVISILAKKVVE